MEQYFNELRALDLQPLPARNDEFKSRFTAFLDAAYGLIEVLKGVERGGREAYRAWRGSGRSDPDDLGFLDHMIGTLRPQAVKGKGVGIDTEVEKVPFKPRYQDTRGESWRAAAIANLFGGSEVSIGGVRYFLKRKRKRVEAISECERLVRILRDLLDYVATR